MPRSYGQLISQRRGLTTSYYHFDGTGSTAQLTNASQSVTDSYTYDARGNPTTSAGVTTNPFRFVGRYGYYFDIDSGTYYVRVRYYDPSWCSGAAIRLRIFPTNILINISTARTVRYD